MKKIIVLIMIVLCSVMATACNSKEVRSVIEKIENIGEISDRTGEKLTEIALEYERLSIDEKEKINNYDVYEQAVKDYESYMRVENVKNQIENIGEITIETRLKLEEIEVNYDSL